MRRYPITTLSLLTIMLLLAAYPGHGQQKPFTQDQVQAMVRDGLGDAVPRLSKGWLLAV